MSNVLLITAEKVREQGYIHENVLPKTITVTIDRVQRVMLRRVMGDEAYKDLMEKVSNSLPPSNPITPLETETKELIEDYIQPYLIACVDYRIIYPLTFRSRAQSTGKAEDDNHNASDIEELIKLKNQMRVDLDAFRESLVEKLHEMEEGEDCSQSERDRINAPGRAIKFR